MVDRLVRWAGERGYRVAWGPARVVEKARRDVLDRRARGEVEAEFFRAEIDAMTLDAAPPPDATLVVVAKPVPAYRVRFRGDGGTVEALIPPTYVRHRAKYEEVRQDLARHGLPGARVEHFGWPLKAVAARLGLVRYGRNNLTYVEGLGSYVQLCGFVTNAELPAGGPTHAPALLDECAGCLACAAACPTGAIDGDRVLIHGERCLTHLNENEGAWPGWLPAGAHHCLVGCLACQEACPANGRLPIDDSGVEFSEEETRMLLAGGGKGTSGAALGLGFKLAWLGQQHYQPVLGRNLRALLDRPAASPN